MTDMDPGSTAPKKVASGHARLMWVWFWASTLSTGLIAGILFGGPLDSPGFNFAGCVGGLLGGAIVAIPTMVVVDLLLKLLAAIRVRPFVQANEPLHPVSQVPSSDQRAADEARVVADAQSTNDSREAQRRATPSVVKRLDTVEGQLAARLLEDPRIVAEGRNWIKMGYGKDVVAGTLSRKASEFGLGDVEIIADDIPDTFG